MGMSMAGDRLRARRGIHLRQWKILRKDEVGRFDGMFLEERNMKSHGPPPCIWSRSSLRLRV